MQKFNKSLPISRVLLRGLLALVGLLMVSCQTVDHRHEVLVSVADQRLVVFDQGQVVRSYPISTSKFGLGDELNSYRTPLGKLQVAQKIGGQVQPGTVFKGRNPTGEVLVPDAPGRDPIVTRILWLRGMESQNKNAYRRYIYIHGTAEERNIGQPVSYGCIRMRSEDVIDLYERVMPGTVINIVPDRLPVSVRRSEGRDRLRQMLVRNDSRVKEREEEQVRQ